MMRKAELKKFSVDEDQLFQFLEERNDFFSSKVNRHLATRIAKTLNNYEGYKFSVTTNLVPNLKSKDLLEVKVVIQISKDSIYECNLNYHLDLIHGLLGKLLSFNYLKLNSSILDQTVYINYFASLLLKDVLANSLYNDLSKDLNKFLFSDLLAEAKQKAKEVRKHPNFKIKLRKMCVTELLRYSKTSKYKQTVSSLSLEELIDLWNLRTTNADIGNVKKSAKPLFRKLLKLPPVLLTEDLEYLWNTLQAKSVLEL